MKPPHPYIGTIIVETSQQWNALYFKGVFKKLIAVGGEPWMPIGEDGSLSIREVLFDKLEGFLLFNLQFPLFIQDNTSTVAILIAGDRLRKETSFLLGSRTTQEQ